MPNRRQFLALVGLSPFALADPAHAFEFRPYDKAAADQAIASGKPVIIHVYATWCLQCHIQASILDGLKGDKTYDGVMFFRVDYDGQRDVVAALNCSRSTIIGYKGGKEVGRMSWGVTQDAVLEVLKAVA